MAFDTPGQTAYPTCGISGFDGYQYYYSHAAGGSFLSYFFSFFFFIDLFCSFLVSVTQNNVTHPTTPTQHDTTNIRPAGRGVASCRRRRHFHHPTTTTFLGQTQDGSDVGHTTTAAARKCK